MTFSCCCSSICHASRNQHPFFNPKEKFKKVCLPQLCYLMCTKGNVNPNYTALYFTLKLFQHLAVQHRLECYLNSLQTLVLKTSANQAQSLFSISLSLCLLHVYVVSFSSPCSLAQKQLNIWYVRKYKVVENIVLGDRLQRSGLNWDIRTHPQMSHCNASTPKELRNMYSNCILLVSYYYVLWISSQKQLGRRKHLCTPPHGAKESALNSKLTSTR